ncbi:hypothetical protein BACUNI_00541 [Bacteroides uniformis ATCC 8492]|uniref:Uncharacterized protein n=1 Tax=Bacteroides uniformis (strain ATCC 8492 / DSM 6597 / CCUG 4942 / CIP 103695 / JCM 5828 / KCTC 5204 / NCTC 13054 / VPI 0061) TaxID=411479 RepID=A0ABC9NGP6_BACUC|nr:hypothetical protein BACUNI_00541 [Bacteroides uniformis ATCC 8492]
MIPCLCLLNISREFVFQFGFVNHLPFAFYTQFFRSAFGY